jgi:thymidylate synthase
MPALFSEPSLDDLLHQVLSTLLTTADRIHPTKGEATELRAVTLELTNPRARLSRSESRGRLFSALGELTWYLSGSDRLDVIDYYLRKYRTFTDGDVVPGAYGPRLQAFDGFDQVAYVIRKLRGHPWSRRAVIQLFDHADVATDLPEVPCTCTLQFLLRDGALELVVYMRSSDAHLGLPHDTFAFTMLQELVARSIGVEPGPYVQIVGSLHLYAKDRATTTAFLKEGWQSNTPMAPMPLGDPGPSVQWLLAVEQALHAGADPLTIPLNAPDNYWNDLACLLGVFSLVKHHRKPDVPILQERLSLRTFDIYIADKLKS